MKYPVTAEGVAILLVLQEPLATCLCHLEMASLALVSAEQGMGMYAAYCFGASLVLWALCMKWEVYWGFGTGIDAV